MRIGRANPLMENSRVAYGELRRKNLPLPTAGIVTETNPLFVERASPITDHPFASKKLVLPSN